MTDIVEKLADTMVYLRLLHSGPDNDKMGKTCLEARDHIMLLRHQLSQCNEDNTHLANDILKSSSNRINWNPILHDTNISSRDVFLTTTPGGIVNRGHWIHAHPIAHPKYPGRIFQTKEGWYSHDGKFMDEQPMFYAEILENPKSVYVLNTATCDHPFRCEISGIYSSLQLAKDAASKVKFRFFIDEVVIDSDERAKLLMSSFA